MLPIQQELFIFKKSVSQLHSAVYRNLKLLLDTLRTKFYADSIIEIILFIEINLEKIIALIKISLFPLSHSPTCNHSKIDVISPGFPLATPLPCPSCPSSHCCATCLMIYSCGWVRSVELVTSDDNN